MVPSDVHDDFQESRSNAPQDLLVHVERALEAQLSLSDITLVILSFHEAIFKDQVLPRICGLLKGIVN